jgi:predicted Rossmann-fold nucleotide-binding protein
MILVGEKFWTATRDYMKVNMLEKNGTISAADLDLFTITDDIEQVMKIIKKAQVSEWWKKMD